MKSSVKITPFDVVREHTYSLPLFISFGKDSLYQITETLRNEYSLINFSSGTEQAGYQSTSLNSLVKRLLDDGALIVDVEVQVNQ